MNVDNEAWDRVHPYLSYGFSPKGQKHVATVGYVPVNAALLAKMKIRIEERGNEEADYISVAPSNCPVGTELSAIPYVNQFGTDKVNYTCSLCPPGHGGVEPRLLFLSCRVAVTWGFTPSLALRRCCRHGAVWGVILLRCVIGATEVNVNGTRNTCGTYALGFQQPFFQRSLPKEPLVYSGFYHYTSRSPRSQPFFSWSLRARVWDSRTRLLRHQTRSFTAARTLQVPRHADAVLLLPGGQVCRPTRASRLPLLRAGL